MLSMKCKVKCRKNKMFTSDMENGKSSNDKNKLKAIKIITQYKTVKPKIDKTMKWRSKSPEVSAGLQLRVSSTILSKCVSAKVASSHI